MGNWRSIRNYNRVFNSNKSFVVMTPPDKFPKHSNMYSDLKPINNGYNPNDAVGIKTDDGLVFAIYICEVNQDTAKVLSFNGVPMDVPISSLVELTSKLTEGTGWDMKAKKIRSVISKKK